MIEKKDLILVESVMARMFKIAIVFTIIFSASEDAH